MLKALDTHNRHINYLRISVTDRCNLRCIYCMPQQGVSLIGHDDILRYEEILRVAAAAAAHGISRIRITGGEPLVRRGITDLLAGLYAIAGITDVSITTNGILLEPMAAALRAAGLRRINISLDSLQPAKYRMITRGGNVDAVLAGIRQARIEGLSPIKINVVVLRGINDDEAVDFARLTLDRPVHIHFIEFMPFESDAGMNEQHFISNAEIQQRIRAVGELLPARPEHTNGPAQLFQLPGACGRIGFISPLSNHFCATCNRLRLTADGRLRACLFSDDEIDLKTPLRQGCSDVQLQKLITEAILSKPKAHRMTEPSFRTCCRSMSAIGG